MFKKILIANRGEIACRIMTTARRMGIKTVAVYSQADKDARHVHMADQAVCIGEAPSRESYLVMERIIAACKETGAQAVHPGYGFLSENEVFARAVIEQGLVFIGPRPESIAAMGDKIASKKLAARAHVNTIPGWTEAIDSAEHAVEIAKGVGYPVMIKASAGGGGKGLRVAWNDKEALEGFTACRSEARSSFGDDRVFIEKFIVEPRHIEIQVLGDAHGNVIYLNERECSLQRRHQKVIEESPSPFISDETRKAMGEQAVALAKAVKYQSAGTVEFVVGADQSFYFLEMNTRLQVEHPVTECVTGIDLVEAMLRVAAGERLTFKQSDVLRRGWAIECRINAEDPQRNFLPSTGRLVRFMPPRQTMHAGDVTHLFGVRVDTGVFEGGEIPMYYDSMIAKLIVHGHDRMDAIQKMRQALNAFVIRGISSNVAFQSALISHPKFAAGDFNTGFIAERYPHGFAPSGQRQSEFELDFLLALAAFVHRRTREGAHGEVVAGDEEDGALTSQESVVKAGMNFVVVTVNEKGEQSHTRTHISAWEDGGWGASWAGTITIGEHSWRIISASALGSPLLEGLANGHPFTAQVDRGGAKRPMAYRILHDGEQIEATVLSPRGAQMYKLMHYKAPPDMSKYLLSPMPGLLIDVAVKVGQHVTAGERLAVIEAMKMENVLVAAHDGVVESIAAAKGESLAVDQIILEFA